MKTSKTAIAAALTALLGFSAAFPVFAQDAGQPRAQHLRHHDGGPRHGGAMGGGLFNFDRGTEAVEIALVRLSHRIELTTEQQPLFDALETAALAAAEDFAAKAENLRPAAPAAEEASAAPDLSARLENNIAIQAARLAALEAVQPAATAFFDSLTAEQAAELALRSPQDGFGKGGPRNGNGFGAPDARSNGPADAPSDAPAPATNG